MGVRNLLGDFVTDPGEPRHCLMMVVLGARTAAPRFAVLGLLGICSLACGNTSRDVGAQGGSGGSAQTGGSVGGGTATGGGANTGGTDTGLLMEGPKLRILTKSEYTSCLSDLLGTISSPLNLPDDTSVAGFVSIGASEVAINAESVSRYESASRAAVSEVFADQQRWQKLVGCEPSADLSDGCVVEFVKSAGKRAYRRDLTEAEVQRWLTVGREAAELPGSSAVHGLAAITSGLLQSFYFLYRVETTKSDAASGRSKYDGPSMATRLAFLLTGGPPSNALLAAAAAGELDTEDGVRRAAAPLLDDPRAVARMAEFFGEVAQADLVSVVEKSPALFPSFNPALQSSMRKSTQLFIEEVVLAPGADVRTFYDSDQAFVDANLAPIYGLVPPPAGFVRSKVGPERAGILGQAAVVAAHSQPDRTASTRRGAFILSNFLCELPEPPPAGVLTPPTVAESGLTTRQVLERTVAGIPCAECHADFDPLGFALEHLDPIGQYRATENGLTIDATGSLDGVSFDGAAQLGAVLRDNPRAVACLVSSFYRDANGRKDARADAANIKALREALAANGYVWRDLVADFVGSEAFRSAPPRLPEGTQ